MKTVPAFKRIEFEKMAKLKTVLIFLKMFTNFKIFIYLKMCQIFKNVDEFKRTFTTAKIFLFQKNL